MTTYSCIITVALTPEGQLSELKTPAFEIAADFPECAANKALLIGNPWYLNVARRAEVLLVGPGMRQSLFYTVRQDDGAWTEVREAPLHGEQYVALVGRCDAGGMQIWGAGVDEPSARTDAADWLDDDRPLTVAHLTEYEYECFRNGHAEWSEGV